MFLETSKFHNNVLKWIYFYCKKIGACRVTCVYETLSSLRSHLSICFAVIDRFAIFVMMFETLPCEVLYKFPNYKHSAKNTVAREVKVI